MRRGESGGVARPSETTSLTLSLAPSPACSRARALCMAALSGSLHSPLGLHSPSMSTSAAGGTIAGSADGAACATRAGPAACAVAAASCAIPPATRASFCAPPPPAGAVWPKARRGRWGSGARSAASMAAKAALHAAPALLRGTAPHRHTAHAHSHQPRAAPARMHRRRALP
jgi:hypothetical protein